MKPFLKKTLKQTIIATPMLLKAINRISGKLPKVLMYHRFAAPGTRMPHRVSGDEFAWQLDNILRDFRVISLAESVDYYILHGSWPNETVIITIDDGYRDMYQWAYPELLKRKVAATFFVTTRFIDGDIWLWPDRIDYLIKNTIHDFMSITTPGAAFNFPLQDDYQKSMAWKALSDYCISISNQHKEEFLNNIETMLEVDLPSSPPPEYSAATWDELHEMQQNGIEIGAHTVNHPILSQIAPLLLDSEVAGSKIVIEERLGARIQSFCYPNGMPNDVNNTVISAVSKAGFTCAVIAFTSPSWDSYRIPRMCVSTDRNDFLWKIYGGESINIVRKGALTNNRKVL